MFATYYHLQALTNLILQMLRLEMTVSLYGTKCPRPESWDLFVSMRLYFESTRYDALWLSMTNVCAINEKRHHEGKGPDRLRDALRQVYRLTTQHRDALPQRDLGMVEQVDLDRFVQGRACLYGPTPEPVRDVWTDEQRKALADKQAEDRAKWFADKPAREKRRCRRIVAAFTEDGRMVLQNEHA